MRAIEEGTEPNMDSPNWKAVIVALCGIGAIVGLVLILISMWRRGL
jgi:hypothetical protein